MLARVTTRKKGRPAGCRENPAPNCPQFRQLTGKHHRTLQASRPADSKRGISPPPASVLARRFLIGGFRNPRKSLIYAHRHFMYIGSRPAPTDHGAANTIVHPAPEWPHRRTVPPDQAHRHSNSHTHRHT